MILELFLKDHETLKTGVMMLNFQLCPHMKKVHFKIYKNLKVILNCFTVF